MRATDRGLLLLIGLLLLWAAGGYAFYRIDRSHHEVGYGLLTELIVHKTALAESTPSPRVIIAGGSNAYYGIDSQVLEQRLGVPVVNFALPFGAYNDRINLHLLERVVRPDDLVVYATARFWATEREAGAGARRARGFERFLAQGSLPDYERQLAGGDLPWQARPETNTLLLAILGGFGPRAGRSWIEQTDERGDYTGCAPTPAVARERYRGEAPNLELAAAVRATAARLERKGARLVITLPWLLIYEHDRRRWAAFRRELLRHYEPAVAVAAADPDVVLRTSREEFCDSPLHLAPDAIRERSERLAADLRHYFRAPGPEPSETMTAAGGPAPSGRPPPAGEDMPRARAQGGALPQAAIVDVSGQTDQPAVAPGSAVATPP